MSAARTVTVTFAASSYGVSVAIAGGTGTVSGAGVSCPGDCTELVPVGGSIALTAVPDLMSDFLGWGSGCTGYVAPAATCNVTNVQAARTVTASFKKKACNSCHGTPPADHVPLATVLADCAGCHPGYSASAVFVPKHLNGSVDASCDGCHSSTEHGQAETTCQSCHGYGRATFWALSNGKHHDGDPDLAAGAGGGCATCHGDPPETSAHAGIASGDHTRCVDCHAQTIDASGSLLVGGKHLDGTVQSSGHAAGFADPAVHGAQFVSSFTTGVSSCESCHGPDYDTCTRCHAESTHLATLGSGDILVFSDANMDHGADFTFNQSCATCHYADLRPQHANRCDACHGDAKPATGLAWDRSCSQTGCHPASHTRSPGDTHFGAAAKPDGSYWNSSANCEQCHDLNTGEWPWPADCLGCHSPPGLR
jgi:hypothetical protein